MGRELSSARTREPWGGRTRESVPPWAASLALPGQEISAAKSRLACACARACARCAPAAWAASLAQPGQDGDSSSKKTQARMCARARVRFPARRRATPRPPQDRGLGPVLILIPLASRRALPPRPCRAAPGRDAPTRGAAGTEEGSLRSMACLVARVGQARDRQGPPEVGRESTLKARLRGLSPPQGQELLPPTLWCTKELRRGS